MSEEARIGSVLEEIKDANANNKIYAAVAVIGFVVFVIGLIGVSIYSPDVPRVPQIGSLLIVLGMVAVGSLALGIVSFFKVKQYDKKSKELLLRLKNTETCRISGENEASVPIQKSFNEKRKSCTYCGKMNKTNASLCERCGKTFEQM